MRTTLPIAMALCLATVVSLAAKPAPVRFINDWQWRGPAAPLLLAYDEGYFDEEGIDVTLVPGKGSTDALSRIASGEFDLGSADMNALAIWRDENPGKDLKAIYVIYNSAPLAVLSRPSLGVIGPQDLEGRTLGAPPTDGAFAQWPTFVVANGIIEDRVTIRDVSFSEREALLAQGEVDAITGFSFTSWVGLQSSGVPSSDISLMLMSDFGLDFYGNVIVVNPGFAEQHPEAAKGFIRAAIRGYQDTIANPSAAIDHVLSRAPQLQGEPELTQLVMAIGHHIVTEEVRTSGLGAVDEHRLNSAIAQLDSVHQFAQAPGAADLFDDSFLPPREHRMP